MEEEIVISPGNNFIEDKKPCGSKFVCRILQEYKLLQYQFKDPDSNKKLLWTKLANRLALNGFPGYTAEMCENLMLKIAKTHSDKSDSLKLTFSKEDSNLKNVVKCTPVPVSTRPNLLAKKMNVTGGHVEVMEMVDNVFGEEEEYDIPENELGVSSNDNQNMEPPIWFSIFLKQYQQDEEKRMKIIEKMHKEVLEVEEKKCTLLAKLIDKLEESRTSKS